MTIHRRELCSFCAAKSGRRVSHAKISLPARQVSAAAQKDRLLEIVGQLYFQLTAR